MPVLQLVPRSHADTIAVFKYLLKRAEMGEIDASEITIRRASDGQPENYFTGLYRTNPAEAGNAALRLCWEVARAQDSDETRPGYPRSY